MSLHASLLRLTKPARYRFDEWLYRRSNEGARLEPLSNIYQDQPILVVGNGPSLNKTPLDAFAHIPAIGMNKIDLIYKRVAWRPSLVICTNNLVVKQHRSSFANSEVPVYLAWKSRWFMPPRSAPNVKYFDSSLDETFSTDITRRVGSAPTVTYAALQFAYFTGANPVMIVGVDHSFDKTGDHVYDKREGPDSNHFDPNYFASGSLWGLPNLDASEIAYARAREAFERDGRKVLDATIGGKLEIFDKIDINEAIALAGHALS